jgi:hypothetical protein
MVRVTAPRPAKAARRANNTSQTDGDESESGSGSAEPNRGGAGGGSTGKSAVQKASLVLQGELGEMAVGWYASILSVWACLFSLRLDLTDLDCLVDSTGTKRNGRAVAGWSSSGGDRKDQSSMPLSVRSTSQTTSTTRSSSLVSTERRPTNVTYVVLLFCPVPPIC